MSGWVSGVRSPDISTPRPPSHDMDSDDDEIIALLADDSAAFAMVQDRALRCQCFLAAQKPRAKGKDSLRSVRVGFGQQN